MAYEPTAWVAGGPPGISAANLNKIEAGIDDVDTRVTSLENTPPVSSVPTGGIMLWTTGIAPGGWLLAQGQSLSRATYAGLFGAIGTIYGSVDADSFSLPDLRGRVPFGFTSALSQFDTLGETGGLAARSLTTTELPVHSHSLSGAATDYTAHSHGGSTGHGGNHQHGYSAPQANSAYNSDGAGSGNIVGNTVYSYSDADSGHSHTVSTDSQGHSHSVSGSVASAGSGMEFSILNPYIVLNYIIKT